MQENSSAERLRVYLNADLDKIDKLIEENPIRLTIKTAAEFLSMDNESVRAVVEGGAFGLAWRKTGKANKAYCVPTPQFVRWYLGVNVLEKVNQ